MRNCAFGFAILIISMITLAVPCDAQIRALWVVRDQLTSAQSITRMVEMADAWNIEVLFVQVRGRGDAYYKSDYVPGPEGFPDIPDELDPLETVIEQAALRNIRVHAWFNMYFTWSDTAKPSSEIHPANAHPEWFMVSKEGIDMGVAPMNEIANVKTEGRYLSPANDEVQDYILQAISEIVVNYNVDGIHLDYVRYPNTAYDYSETARTKFKRRHGADPLDVINKDSQTDEDFKLLEETTHFRVNQIDAHISRIDSRIELLDSHVLLSAAVKPNPHSAYYNFGQNWAGWLEEGYLDFVVLMSYAVENESLAETLDIVMRSNEPYKVMGGVGIYRIPPEQAGEQIRMIEERGLLGFCLFSYTTLISDRNYIEDGGRFMR